MLVLKPNALNTWLFALFFAKLTVLHPFHVSVTDITYSSDERHFKISIRIFLDDLEVALQRNTSNEKLDVVRDTSLVNQAMKEYILKNLSATADGKALELDYLGNELEYDVMWCYVQVKKLKPFDQITMTNTLLHEVYRNQENLVHVRKDGVVRSMRFQPGDGPKSVDWN